MLDLMIKILITIVVMGLIDFIWLGYIAKKLYKDELGPVLAEKPNMTAALLFYILYGIGIVVFVINPALIKASLLDAVYFGGLFGLVSYAVYDLTNLATMKNFSVKIAAIDLAWGSCITASTSLIVYVIINSLPKAS